MRGRTLCAFIVASACVLAGDRPEVRLWANGAAMVIAAGGGHQFLNFDQEGTYVADYRNRIGVAGFVLKYRLAREPGSTYKVDVDALGDAQRAIRLIRSRAEEWHVDTARAGIMGFSAGGEVTALAATRFDAGKPDAADPIDRQSSRPEVHVYATGGHGFGINPNTKNLSPVIGKESAQGRDRDVPGLLATRPARLGAEGDSGRAPIVADSRRAIPA